jgi:hypothetical protein
MWMSDFRLFLREISDCCVFVFLPGAIVVGLAGRARLSDIVRPAEHLILAIDLIHGLLM